MRVIDRIFVEYLKYVFEFCFETPYLILITFFVTFVGYRYWNWKCKWNVSEGLINMARISWFCVGSKIVEQRKAADKADRRLSFEMPRANDQKAKDGLPKFQVRDLEGSSKSRRKKEGGVRRDWGSPSRGPTESKQSSGYVHKYYNAFSNIDVIQSGQTSRFQLIRCWHLTEIKQSGH